MNLPFFFARRYFFSRKNPSAINIITFISIFGYAVGSFALIALLSALNGFEGVIFKVYDSYYADLKIEAKNGKVFVQDSNMFLKLKQIPGVRQAVFCLEENAIIQSQNNQVVALIKGVGVGYEKIVKTDSLVVSGDPVLQDRDGPLGWMAEGLVYKLDIGKTDNVVHLMTPRRETFGVSQMEMQEEDLRIASMIRPGEEMNQQLIVSTLPFAQEYFEREGQVSSIEVAVADARHTDAIAEKIEALYGKGFTVKNRSQQNQAVYKMFNTEKWVAFAIMAFVLLLITFNLVGSLSMLVLEKKKDISLLKSVGMKPITLRQIFFSEGVLVAMAGCLLGVVSGLLVVWLQLKYGIITTNSSFVIAYPVEIRLTDVFLVGGLGLLLGISGALYPALRSARMG